MPAPSRLGRYPVRRRIGSGAFATVWLAHDEQLDSPVAIKVLADNWAGDLHVRRRFVEEGRFLRKVESPHVVSVYDAGELDDGRPYLVMAFADQGTLADRLEVGPLDPSRALQVIAQVGQGLTALHHRGVLHRDVKPANVLFRTIDQGDAAHVVAMVGDLGLGKSMDMSSRLTMVGGTPTYVAPEQARGEGLDARADQFSLAALAYVLLAGRNPYDHTSLLDAQDPTPPVPMGIDNEEAEAVVRRALSKDREGRFADITDFTDALATALGRSGGETPQPWIPVDPAPTRPARRPDEAARTDDLAWEIVPSEIVPREVVPPRRRWLWLVAAVLALVIGAGAGWVIERARAAEEVLDDSTGKISVTVPEPWTAQVDPEPWAPLDGGDQSAIAAGSAPGWNTSADPAPGVFAGILPSDRLPSTVPQHPECTTAGEPILGNPGGDESMTVFYTGCPGVDVTVERVRRITANQLLWVQIRSDDQGTANRVLDSVEVHGVR